MYKDLIKRLNAYSAEHENHGGLTAEAADTIEQLSKLADAIPHVCKYCVGCELEKKNGGCDHVFVLSPKRAMQYLIKPRWIPVTEQLPDVDETKDEYENVTVLASSKGWKKSRPLIYERACVRGKTVYRWKYISGKIYDGLPVTHWMPLPDAQKEET